MRIRQLATTTTTAAILAIAGAVIGAPAMAEDADDDLSDKSVYDVQTGEYLAISAGGQDRSPEEASVPEHIQETLAIH